MRRSQSARPFCSLSLSNQHSRTSRLHAASAHDAANEPAPVFDTEEPVILSLDSVLELLPNLDSLPSNITEASVAPLWTEINNAETLGHLTPRHIDRLTFLIQHRLGPSLTFFMSVKSLIARLEQSDCDPSLLIPIYISFLHRCASNLQTRDILNILSSPAFELSQSLAICKRSLFSDALSSLARHGRVQDVQVLINYAPELGIDLDGEGELMDEETKDTNNQTTNVRSYRKWPIATRRARIIALAHSHVRDIDAILDIVTSADPASLSLKEAAIALNACVDAGNAEAFDTIWNMFTTSPTHKHLNTRVYSAYMRHKLATKGLEAGLACFALMRQANLKPSIYEYSLVIEHLFQIGRADRAMSLFDRLRLSEDTVPTARTYCLMIHSCAKQGMALHAFRYHYALQESGLQLSAQNWATLVAAFTSMDEMQTAIQCFQDMLRDTLHDPTVYMFSVLISGFIKRGEYQKALEYYNMSTQWGLSLDNVLLSLWSRAMLLERNNVNPATVINVYKPIVADLKAKFEITQIPPSNFSQFFRFIEMYVMRVGTADAAEAVVIDAHTLGIDTKPLLNLLMSAYALHGNISGALQLLDELNNQSIPIPIAAYNNLIAGILKHKGDVQLALTLLDNMIQKDLEIRPFIFNRFFMHYNQNHQPLNDLLDRMKLIGVRFDDITFAELVQYYWFEKRDFDSAWDWWIKYDQTLGPFTNEKPPMYRVVAKMARVCRFAKRFEKEALVLAFAERTLPVEQLS
eukprot:jgi/Hompol1/5598/HPOL_004568-RA